MAQAQRDFQLQQAQCDAAVSARKAQADLAYQLQVGGGCGTTPPPTRGCYPRGYGGVGGFGDAPCRAAGTLWGFSDSLGPSTTPWCGLKVPQNDSGIPPMGHRGLFNGVFGTPRDPQCLLSVTEVFGIAPHGTLGTR